MPLSRSPAVLKGALVRLDDDGATAEAVVFQYNPQTLRRRLESRDADAPRETITFMLRFDAADALERAADDSAVVEHGIAPMLAALELLMVRRARERRWWEFWVPAGLETPPLALFVYGVQRAAPVRVLRLDVAELLHDPELRPIRATVKVALEVVSEDDLPRGHHAIELWRAHIRRVETLAGHAHDSAASVDVPRG